MHLLHPLGRKKNHSVLLCVIELHSNLGSIRLSWREFGCRWILRDDSSPLGLSFHISVSHSLLSSPLLSEKPLLPSSFSPEVHKLFVKCICKHNFKWQAAFHHRLVINNAQNMLTAKAKKTPNTPCLTSVLTSRKQEDPALVCDLCLL